MKRVPARTPRMILHEATLVYKSISNPMPIKRVEVSPIDPGILPIKASSHEYSFSILFNPPSAPRLSKVGEVNPSKATHTESPDQVIGYAKYKKALPVRAGFKKFLPVPPKTSFPITNPKLIPKATCHKGASGGQHKANRTVVTKAPSFIS